MDRETLATALATVCAVDQVDHLQRLSGGASRQTWSFTADGRPLIWQGAEVVLPGRVGAATESALLRAAAGAGVPVARVVTSSVEHPEVLSGDWMVVAAVEGETLARRILRNPEFAAARSALTGQCATALAALHSVDPDSIVDLGGADQWNLDVLGATIANWRQPLVTFELALRQLRLSRPEPVGDAVVHGDFRLGNLIVGPDGLRAVVDWELAHRGDPLEDLGWLCVRAWRFGAAPPVGGFGERAELVAAYEAAGGRVVDPAALRWWELFGTLKWGVICLAQVGFHLSGASPSVELAAIGRRVCEVEFDLLTLLLPAAGDGGGPHAADVEGEPSMERERVELPPFHDAPTAAELLAAVETFLAGLTENAALSGRDRFQARVSNGVLAQVRRELSAGPTPAAEHRRRVERFGFADDADLAAAIRRGELDERIAAAAELVRPAVLAKLAVANPRYSD
jgi:aminoglycoside phosphotransferase (APT) family kinase protein